MTKNIEIFSHSKLSLYEMCPEAYKVKYIEKTFPELPSSIHAHLGSMVHEALEFLYGEVMSGKEISLDEVIEFYAKKWHDQYKMDIRVPIGENADTFFNKGIKFIIDYYRSNRPFSKLTVCTEKKILFPLSENVHVQGYIDRIEKHEDGSYEVHDYKTNEKMKEQKEVDADRQLAFYHLGLQDIYGKEIKVKLTWHFLAHNKKIHSFRTPEQLDILKKQTLALVEKIKNTSEWYACEKPWCDWCAYKKMSGMESNVRERTETRKIFSLNGELNKWL